MTTNTEVVEMQKDRKAWHHWMRNYSLGDLVAMGGVASIGRFLLMNYSQKTLLHSEPGISWLTLIVVGALEGILIGFIEWKSLSGLINLKSGSWIAVTVLATAIGWLFILSPAIVYISVLSRFSEINRTYFAIYTGIAGMSFGTLVGIPQYLILKKFYKNSVMWILANALAWMLSFVIIYSALAMFTHSAILNVLLTGFACAASGLLQGTITGLCLHFSMTLRNE
jgi:hypothetical protein